MIRFKQPRHIVILVDQRHRDTPEHTTALQAIEDELKVTDDDLVVLIAAGFVPTDTTGHERSEAQTATAFIARPLIGSPPRPGCTLAALPTWQNCNIGVAFCTEEPD